MEQEDKTSATNEAYNTIDNDPTVTHYYGRAQGHAYGVCPSCGYCPCCGRGGYIPYYPYYQTPVWSYTNTGGQQ